MAPNPPRLARWSSCASRGAGLAVFEALLLGGLEAGIVGQSLHLGLPDVKDKTRNTGDKIELTRADSPGRSIWEPLSTMTQYARSIEELRDPVALRAVYVKRFGLPPARLALACRSTQVMHGQQGHDDGGESGGRRPCRGEIVPTSQVGNPCGPSAIAKRPSGWQNL